MAVKLEIYTHVAIKDLSRVKSPLDSLGISVGDANGDKKL